MFTPAINYRPTREIMTKKSDNKNGMKKVVHRPVAVSSSKTPHPKKTNKKGHGRTGEQVMVGAFFWDEKVVKYLFAFLGSLLTNQNSVNTVAGWTEWDDFRNEETRTDFIIQTLTTQSKWRQRGRVIHMGWHIPDILMILYNQGYCDSKQILKIVNGFEGVTISKVPGWSETTKKLKGSLPDVLHKISVDGPVKFEMEFAVYTDKGKEKCYIGSTAFGDKPSLMQWFRGKDGKYLIDRKPKWQRYAAHHRAAPDEYTMSPSEIKKANREKAKNDRGAKHSSNYNAEVSQEDRISDDIARLKRGERWSNE
tara:strand:- start:8722 stop:9648 length:927 start_codon:yes stop_codon:yes gene_type:complete